jgi:hypothetical protein
MVSVALWHDGETHRQQQRHPESRPGRVGTDRARCPPKRSGRLILPGNLKGVSNKAVSKTPSSGGIRGVPLLPIIRRASARSGSEFVGMSRTLTESQSPADGATKQVESTEFELLKCGQLVRKGAPFGSPPGRHAKNAHRDISPLPSKRRNEPTHGKDGYDKENFTHDRRVCSSRTDTG